MAKELKKLGDKIETPKPEIVYPSVSLNSDQMDGLDGLKLGDNVKLVFIGKVRELHQGKDYSSKEGLRIGFQLTQGTMVAKKKPRSVQEGFKQASEAQND